MDHHRAASLLGQTRLFAELDHDILRTLGERTIERSYKKGQLIFCQGDLGESLYVLVNGVVKVFVTSERGDEMVLTTLHPPDVFGELALIDGGPRSASAEALEPAAVLVLTRPTLLELLAQHPSLTDSLLRSLGAVLRRLTEQTSDLVFLDLHGRVAKLLLNLGSEQENQVDGIVVLDLQMTQSDLAGMVGGSRQSVNQILQYFQGRGYIELDGRRVKLMRPDLLRRRAGLKSCSAGSAANVSTANSSRSAAFTLVDQAPPWIFQVSETCRRLAPAAPSNTRRTARSRISGGYLRDVVMGSIPSSSGASIIPWAVHSQAVLPTERREC